MFCPKCGTLMRPKRVNESLVMVCPNCGFVKVPDDNDREKMKFRESVTQTGDSLVVVEETITLNIDHAVVCPKCGNKGAYYKSTYDLSNDTGFTIYKCIKCGHTWREEE